LFVATEPEEIVIPRARLGILAAQAPMHRKSHFNWVCVSRSLGITALNLAELAVVGWIPRLFKMFSF